MVTGGGSGIGLAVGRALVAAGAARVVLADVDAGRAEAAAAALGPTASAAELDAADGGQVAALVEAVAREHGRLDLMFNNAGIGGTLPFDRAGPEHWERIVSVNLWSAVHGTRAAYRQMVRQGGGGHIVNTASVSGLVPVPMQTLYNTTKYAVVGLSTSLRPEAAAHGVRVTAVCPGMVATGIFGVPIIGAANPAARPPAGAVPADAAAARILAGVARDRGLIVFPARDRALTALHRHAPALAARLLAAEYRRRAASLEG